jgi:hypothetical protein
MAAKKSRSPKKGSSASRSRAGVSGAVPPYGPPIRDAISRGNLSEMKALAARTRKYIAEIERALKALEGKIAKH